MVKDVKNNFRLQKAIDDTAIKLIKIFLDWKKKIEQLKKSTKRN